MRKTKVAHALARGSVTDAIRARIHANLTELAARLGIEATGLTDDELIPATGLLDSAAMLALVVWYEGSIAL